VELCFSQGPEVGELTASAGVAIYPSDGCDVETLVENAEEALRRAALAGGGRACFYRDPEP
jgi:GGDEF domain-containing protein